MTPPLLVIVTGPPASGKSTLATRLATDLQLPLMTKDTIKEKLFDSLGWEDRTWSKRLGMASYDLLFVWIEAQLRAHRSALVEANFYVQWHSQRFADLGERFPFRPFQINCCADGEVLVERVRHRTLSGERHPGHVEEYALPEMESLLRRGFTPPLDLPGPTVELDSTDFAAMPYDDLLVALQKEVQQVP